ncbi:hypothetical protein ABKN59_001100 [Abortiporus biennis]
MVLNGYDSNTAGKGGVSSSGAAIAGSTHHKRSNVNHGQAGSAYTGNTGSVNGGSVYNSGGKVINGAFSNNAGKGGYSISGDAYAGNGVGEGSAFSGSTGSANGGSVYNSGGTVISGFASNTAGKSGVSSSVRAGVTSSPLVYRALLRVQPHHAYGSCSTNNEKSQNLCFKYPVAGICTT